MGITIITQAFPYFCAVKEPVKLVILVSGKGSNARNLVSYFKKNQHVIVCGIVSSKQNPALESYCAENQLFYEECYPWNEERILPVLDKTGIEVIVDQVASKD
jgi:folate-dependent phosphoribosylglycinamide formyltransferase PurN